MNGELGNPEFWKQQTVLVTGHTGFKGSWFCLWLNQMGARVIGYGLGPPSVPSLYDSANVAQFVESFEGNILDPNRLNDVVRSTKPTIVFHMAAQSLVLSSYEQPSETYATNVMGTVNILEACRQFESIRAFINITSDKCYENPNTAGELRPRTYREEDKLGGDDPYSCSKACSELITASYRASYFEDGRCAIATARSGNVIGGGDWAVDRLVPDMMRSLQANKPINLRFPQAIRPWQHVLEPLHGYCLLAEALLKGHPESCGAWNFGPDSYLSGTLTALGLARGLLAHYLPSESNIDRFVELGDGNATMEAAYLSLNTSKAMRLLRWKPLLSTAQMLHWVSEWYQSVASGHSAQAMTLEQIARYEALMEKHQNELTSTGSSQSIRHHA